MLRNIVLGGISSLVLLMAASGCDRVARATKPAARLVYDYALQVEDTEYGGDPHKVFSVLTGETKARTYRNVPHASLTEHAYLFVYSTIYRVASAPDVLLPRFRFVP